MLKNFNKFADDHSKTTGHEKEHDTGADDHWRWWMVVLLFVATTVNYMDRQVLSLTWKDFIAPEFHWTDNDYGTITAFFSIIYAICMLFAGKFVD